MRTWFKLLAIFLGSTALLLAALIVFRKTILVLAAQSYFASHNIELQLEAEEISLHRMIVKNIVIDSKNTISYLSLGFSLFSDGIFSLRSLKLDVKSLDVGSLQIIQQKIMSPKNTKNSPPSFSEGLVWCRQIQEMPIQVTIGEIVVGQKTFPFNLKTDQKNQTLHLIWQAPSFTQGELHLQCQPNQISMQIPKMAFSAQDLIFADNQIDEIKFDISNAFLSWSKDSSLQAALPGRFNLALTKDNKDYSLRVPSLLISAQSFLNNPQKIEIRLRAEKLKTTASQTISAAFLEFVNKVDWSVEPLTIEGHWTLKNFALQENEKKQWVAGLNSKANYSLVGLNSYKLTASAFDGGGSVQISNLRMSGDTSLQEHSVSLQPKKTILNLKSTTLQLLPFLKESIQRMSGQISVGGELHYRKQILDGRLNVVGKNISTDTEWGKFSGIDFEHSVISFKNFASPPHQFLRIKKIDIGQSFEDFAINYQVANLQKVHVAQCSLAIDKARLMAEKFAINLTQKRIENFSVRVTDLDLERVLAVGLKDAVKAQGQLSGNINLTFEGSKPVLSGLLKDSKKGWIQYRTATSKASQNLSLNDGPMDILNNYLYDFQYENLSLAITTNKVFDMKMKLSTLGRNPNYLGGKPLLLNVNLEQNLLAAMQSMMLTYDLPSRLKERLEKVEP